MSSARLIRETLDRIVEETPNGGGLVMTVEIRAYDNGMINISGTPLPSQGMLRGGSVDAWNAANEVFSQLLRGLARRVRDRVVAERDAA